jgi:hypothetical protein
VGRKVSELKIHVRVQRCAKRKSVEGRTIDTRVPMVDNILNGIANRSEDLPARWTLALRPQPAGARISGGDRGEQIWGNGGVWAIKIAKSDAQGLSLVAETTRRLNNGLCCCADGSSHDAVYWFLLVIPGNLLDERQPCSRQTDLQPMIIRLVED